MTIPCLGRAARRTPGTLPGALALALAACSHAPAPATGHPAPRHAILVLLDAARADRFSCYGYDRPTTPNIDRLAARGRVYLQHFANGVSTRTSLPSLFYSRYFAKAVFPFDAEIPVYRPSELFRAQDPAAISLPKALEADGFHTVGISAHQWFRQDSELARQFTEFHDLPREVEFPAKYGYPRADAVVDATIRWISAAPRDEDWFLYLHVMDTHFPHFFEEDAQELFGADHYESQRVAPDGDVADLDEPLTGDDRRYMDALYDGGLRYADRQLGRLFDFLAQRGELDSTLIAITADHGEELLDRPHFFTHGNWEEAVAHIPLVVSYPRALTPARTDVLTSGVDLDPTFLRLLGAPLPAGKTVDGLDLLSGLDGKGREHVFAWCGMRSKRWKLVCNFVAALEGVDPGPAYELFDLAADPEAYANVAGEHPDVVHDMLTLYVQRMGPAYRRYQATRRDVPPEGPFALRPLDLGVKGVTAVGDSSSPDWWRTGDAPGGWVRNTDARERSCLLARPGAGALEIRQPLPSGEYDLSLSAEGRCRVEVDGLDAPVEIAGPAFTPGPPQELTPLLVGRIRVEGAVFRAVLHPETEDGPFRLELLSFTPAGYVRTDAERAADAERTRQLRNLGYGGGPAEH